MTLTVNIIGAGKLGKTLAYLFHQHQLLKILAVCNSSEESANQAIAFIHAGTAASSINSLPGADLTLITTPDHQIEAICQELAHSPNLKPNSIVAHCSGAMTSAALTAAKLKNCHIASIHPMTSFADPELSIHHYQHIFCATEGDPQALEVLLPLFHSIGSITYEISKDKKVLYHAGSVFACNYLITLTQLAQLCFAEAGIDSKTAMQLIMKLMQGTINNLATLKSAPKALTGPIQRGDFKTIAQHMQALTQLDLHETYAQLAQQTLPLANLDEEARIRIMAALNPLTQH